MRVPGLIVYDAGPPPADLIGRDAIPSPMVDVTSAMNAVHVLFGGAWVGGVVLMALVVLPKVKDGTIPADALDALLSPFLTLSRASALVLFLSGGHLAGVIYGSERLFGTGQGHLVLAMLALWAVLIALVEAGSGVLRRDGGSVDRGLTLYRAAAAIGAVLLLIGGLLG